MAETVMPFIFIDGHKHGGLDMMKECGWREGLETGSTWSSE
jgi:hypothetical protein